MQTGPEGSSGLAPELVRPGTPVAMDGPLGSFTFPAHPRERRFVFIAGGTGIAPLRSMLWHTLLAERDGQVALIYSVRSPEEFAYMQEFQRLEDEGRIEFRHTVTRAATDGWLGRQGRIDVQMSGWIDQSRRNALLRVRTAGAHWRDSPAADGIGRQGRSDTYRELGVVVVQSANLPISRLKSPSR